MSQLLEIIGRAMEYDVSDLIWQWLKDANEKESNADRTTRRLLDEVIRLVDSKKTETAAKKLSDYLSVQPDSVHARLAAAALALAENKLEDALCHLTEIYHRCAGNVMALYALGHCCERLGAEAQAIAYYQDCLKFKNYLQLPRQRLAAIYFKNGQLEKTISQYELLRDEYPDDISTLLTLGSLHIAAGNFAAAAEAFSTAILIHPDNFSPDTNEIDLFTDMGELQQALDLVEYMAQDQPERPDLVLRRADILTALGENNDALLQYIRAVSICPDFLEANIKLGTQYRRMNRPRDAAQQFNNAVEVNNRIVDAYLGLALTQKLDSNPSDALRTLALAAAIDENSPLLFGETAVLQFHQQNSIDTHSCPDPRLINDVINAHRKNIQLRPHNPILYYQLAILLMRIGHITEPITLLKTALTINPTFERARSKLAICLLETDEQALALENLTAADYLSAEMINLHYKVALLYCNKPKFASSLLNLTRQIGDSVSAADPTQNISLVLQNLGLLNRAFVSTDNLLHLARQAKN